MCWKQCEPDAFRRAIAVMYLGKAATPWGSLNECMLGMSRF